MRVLITGSKGATASYLAEYIEAEHPDEAVYGLAKPECDLNDLGAVIRTLRATNPHRIFHLAAMPHVHESFSLAHQTLSNNVLGTMNLFEAMSIVESDARVLVTSSCEVYGIPQYSPMDEEHPFNPVSPYGVSKCAVDHLSQMYAKRGMHIVISRMFNHICPRAKRLFSTQWAKQVAEIEKLGAGHLYHGNLDSARTLLDVRDVVRGYWLLLEHGRPGEAYNIGADKETTLREFIDLLSKAAGFEIPLRESKALYRPIDIVRQIADSHKFADDTGWAPTYTLEDSVRWLLNYWRKKIK
jgi:GDP-4-dehydro-6-deoxy-D-mannose reductase